VYARAVPCALGVEVDCFFGLHGGRDGSWCLYVYGEAVAGLVLMDVGVKRVGGWSLGG
jgi:hypothetical protein